MVLQYSSVRKYLEQNNCYIGTELSCNTINGPSFMYSLLIPASYFIDFNAYTTVGDYRTKRRCSCTGTGVNLI